MHAGENIGVGLSAYTKIDRLFYVNTFSLSEYIKSVESSLPVATTIMSLNQAMKRWFMMGLYRLRVDKAEFEKHFGVELERAMGGPCLCLSYWVSSKNIQVIFKLAVWASFTTKTFMLTFLGRYIQECMLNPWPSGFQI